MHFNIRTSLGVSETCCDILSGDGGTNKKTGGRGGGGRTEDALLGDSWMDGIRNEYIRGIEQVEQFGHNVREARLR